MLSKSLRRALISVLAGGTPLVAYVACDQYPYYRHGGGLVIIGADDDDLEDLGEDLFDDDDFFDDLFDD